MDTRTRTASPTGDNEDPGHTTPPPPQDKISAYYSLVFPHYTFYIQTLSITIGRRCAPNSSTSSTAESTQVDVDLGALKSVSRLHAKIEYDQEEDRFVLIVVGRNGAWVDGVWSGSGTRAPLGERSQIQIASRTFHFILPPPPPPEDTPSPSSQSSAHRPRSPSIDITSISPPSSQPSHSPPPPLEVKLPPPSPEPQLHFPVSPPPKPKPRPQPQLPPQPELPNSNSIGKSGKNNPKKRKKSDVEPPHIMERPKPEDMPPKPPFTYAQLIYRAIKEIGGKATLQEICSWIMNTHEYYRYADGAWMSSVRHNLSSSRAFLKMERCGGDRGKGFFWSVDEKFSQTLEEQETKVKQAAAAAAQGFPPGSSDISGKNRKKDKGALLDPPLKRSVKGDMKGVPLPPPLTSSPLPFRNALSPTAVPSAALVPPQQPSSTLTPDPPKSSINLGTPTTATTGAFAYPSIPHNPQPQRPNPSQQSSVLTSGYSSTPISGPNPYAPLTQPNWGMHPVTTNNQPSTSSHTTPTPSTPNLTTLSPQPPPPAAAVSAAVPDVVIPIILGPIPPTHPDYLVNHPNNSAKEGYMILHERKLILDPDVFAELTKEMLTELEKMGAQKALGILTSHMVRALKERRAKERGKDRGNRRPKGTGRGGAARKSTVATTAPFTNVPLGDRKKPVGDSPNKPVEGEQSSTTNANVDVKSTIPIHDVAPTMNMPIGTTQSGQAEVDPGSPIIIIDDDSEDEEPASKRRKMEGGLAVAS